jgi:hypothetical protein
LSRSHFETPTAIHSKINSSENAFEILSSYWAAYTLSRFAGVPLVCLFFSFSCSCSQNNPLHLIRHLNVVFFFFFFLIQLFNYDPTDEQLTWASPKGVALIGLIGCGFSVMMLQVFPEVRSVLREDMSPSFSYLSDKRNNFLLVCFNNLDLYNFFGSFYCSLVSQCHFIAGKFWNSSTTLSFVTNFHSRILNFVQLTNFL